MATLYLSVFYGASEVAMGDPYHEEAVAISGTSNASTAIPHPTGNPGKARIRVRALADVDCFCHWGDPTPVALSDGTQGRAMAAGAAEYFDIEAGHMIAVIERT